MKKSRVRSAKIVCRIILTALAAAFLALAVPYCRRAASLDSCPDLFPRVLGA